MKTLEIKEYTEKLKKINIELWKEYSKEELENTLSDSKKCLTHMETVSNLEEELKRFSIVSEDSLEENKDKLEKFRIVVDEKKQILKCLNSQQELYSCPSCNNKLRFKDDELHLAEEISFVDTEDDIENLKKDIKTLQSQIRNLEKIIPEEENNILSCNNIKNRISLILSEYEERQEINELQEDIEYLKEYKTTQLSMERKKINLEKALQEEYFKGFNDATELAVKTIKKL